MDHRTLHHESLQNLVNIPFGAAGLAEGTNANTIKTANAIDYTIGGKMYSKGATDNIAMTACAQQADGTDCMYLISIDSAGNVTTTKGEEVAAGAGAYLPDVPANEAVIGAIKVNTNGATFTSGGTDLSAANITATVYDLAGAHGDSY